MIAFSIDNCVAGAIARVVISSDVPADGMDSDASCAFNTAQGTVLLQPRGYSEFAANAPYQFQAEPDDSEIVGVLEAAQNLLWMNVVTAPSSTDAFRFLANDRTIARDALVMMHVTRVSELPTFINNMRALREFELMLIRSSIVPASTIDENKRLYSSRLTHVASVIDVPTNLYIPCYHRDSEAGTPCVLRLSEALDMDTFRATVYSMGNLRPSHKGENPVSLRGSNSDQSMSICTIARFL